MKTARQSPMRFCYVAGESAVYYLHHEGQYFIPKRLHYADSKFFYAIYINGKIGKFK
jgi:hypothetical protein